MRELSTIVNHRIYLNKGYERNRHSGQEIVTLLRGCLAPSPSGKTAPP
jgi:hypothetical protein